MPVDSVQYCWKNALNYACFSRVCCRDCDSSTVGLSGSTPTVQNRLAASHACGYCAVLPQVYNQHMRAYACLSRCVAGLRVGLCGSTCTVCSEMDLGLFVTATALPSSAEGDLVSSSRLIT
jgi:hypothetical protein